MDANGASPTFSLTQVWNDAAAMLRGNGGLLLAIAGVFIFLPDLLLARFAPPPAGATNPAEFTDQMQSYFQANFPWLLLSILLNMVAAIAIFLLLLARPRMTVGAAVGAALPILPFYFLLTLVLNLAVGIGFLLLILPGIYLLGRLALAGPVLVAEMPRAPGSALGRAWTMSGRWAWQIALMLLLIYIVGSLIGFAVQAALGSVILLALGNQGVGGLLVAALGAAVGAAVTVVATVVTAAIYRAVAPGGEPARVR